jgi:hypothetical protein
MLVPAAPAAVAAQQRGASVKLQLMIPEKNRAGRPIKGVAGINISKRVTDVGQKDVCRVCMADYKLFRSLYLDSLATDSQRFGNNVIVMDDDVSIGKSYSYGVSAFTVDGIDGASYVTAEINMLAPLQAPSLKIEQFSTEVKLLFISPPLISGRLLGYNLYRSSLSESKPFVPVNIEPIKLGEYIDASLERGVKYRYSVRTIVMMESGTVAESVESEEVIGLLKNEE